MPPEGEVTYEALLAGPVALFEPSGSLKPTAMCSVSPEPTVSSGTVNRRMSSDMPGLWVTSRIAPPRKPR